MFKRNFYTTILLFLMTSYMQAMEKSEPTSISSSSTNWEKFKFVGPIKELKFERTLIDTKGRHVGWLYSEEFNDHIYSAVTLHDDGYYVDFVDLEYKESLPLGLYYWKSSNLVKLAPTSKFEYIVKEVEYSTQPRLAPVISYKTEHNANNNEYFESMEFLSHGVDRTDRYKYLPSFEKAFNNCCTNVYLDKKIEPITLVADNLNLIKDGYLYMEFSKETKQKILALLPNNIYKILKAWLEDTLKNTGLSKDRPTEGDSKEYIMNQDGVIDQFIIESLVKFIQKFGDLSRKERPSEIDVYKILEEIEDLKPCSAESRKEFEEHLIQRFGSWDNRRITGLTAIGIIECNPGILQWD